MNVARNFAQFIPKIKRVPVGVLLTLPTDLSIVDQMPTGFWEESSVESFAGPFLRSVAVSSEDLNISKTLHQVKTGKTVDLGVVACFYFLFFGYW